MFIPSAGHPGLAPAPSHAGQVGEECELPASPYELRRTSGCRLLKSSAALRKELVLRALPVGLHMPEQEVSRIEKGNPSEVRKDKDRLPVWKRHRNQIHGSGDPGGDLL